MQLRHFERACYKYNNDLSNGTLHTQGRLHPHCKQAGEFVSECARICVCASVLVLVVDVLINTNRMRIQCTYRLGAFFAFLIKYFSLDLWQRRAEATAAAAAAWLVSKLQWNVPCTTRVGATEYSTHT